MKLGVYFLSTYHGGCTAREPDREGHKGVASSQGGTRNEGTDNQPALNRVELSGSQGTAALQNSTGQAWA